MAKKANEFLREIRERREKQVPWCIDKRCGNVDGKQVVWDATGHEIAPDPTIPIEQCHGINQSYAQLLLREARDYVPFGSPPDWPGAVAVFHPASWEDAGDFVEGLAKRFRKDIHVVQTGDRWILVFVGEPAEMDGRDIYSERDGRWHSKVTVDGGNECHWQGVAAS